MSYYCILLWSDLAFEMQCYYEGPTLFLWRI